MEGPWDSDLAVVYVRLGKLADAHASIERLLKIYPQWTIEKEAVWPTTKQPQLTEQLQKKYLADLAQAGLPQQ